MARKQKPPGFEKWTWEEIRLGRRLSKGEKRMRRAAKGLGATEKEDGGLDHTWASFGFVFLMFVLAVSSLILGTCTNS